MQGALCELPVTNHEYESKHGITFPMLNISLSRKRARGTCLRKVRFSD